MISCDGCKKAGRKAEYCGETARTPYLRGQEHLAAHAKGHEDSALFKHDVLHHGGEVGSFSMRVLMRHKKPLARQMHEATYIENSVSDIVMNSKCEYNGVRVPRVTIEVGGRLYTEEYRGAEGPNPSWHTGTVPGPTHLTTGPKRASPASEGLDHETLQLREQEKDLRRWEDKVRAKARSRTPQKASKRTLDENEPHRPPAKVSRDIRTHMVPEDTSDPPEHSPKDQGLPRTSIEPIMDHGLDPDVRDNPGEKDKDKVHKAQSKPDSLDDKGKDAPRTAKDKARPTKYSFGSTDVRYRDLNKTLMDNARSLGPKDKPPEDLRKATTPKGQPGTPRTSSKPPKERPRPPSKTETSTSTPGPSARTKDLSKDSLDPKPRVQEGVDAPAQHLRPEGHRVRKTQLTLSTLWRLNPNKLNKKKESTVKGGG